MKKTAVVLALCSGLLGAQQDHTTSPAAYMLGSETGFTGRIQLMDGQPKLEALSIIAIGPATKAGTAPILIESFDPEGRFRSEARLPEKFEVNTLPDPCIAVKSLVLNEITEPHKAVSADRLGVTTTVHSGAVEGAGMNAKWTSTEQFKGAEWSLKFELPLPAFAKMFKLPSVQTSGRVGGIGLSCEQSPVGRKL